MKSSQTFLNLACVTWDQLSKNKTEVTNDWEAMKRYREEVGIDIH